MTVTVLLGSWVVAALIVLLGLFFLAMGYTTHHERSPHNYKRLDRINHIVRRSRIAIVLLAMIPAVLMVVISPHYQSILAAPSIWAVIVIMGLVGVDWAVLGRDETTGALKPKVSVRDCLPWGLIAVFVIFCAVLGYGAYWAESNATSDNRSHLYTWVLDGAFGWGTTSPFPGTFYTGPMLQIFPFVLVAAVGAIAVILMRSAYLPTPKYAALDQGFRRRTIRDVVLVCLGAVTPVLAMMGMDIAWVYSSVGPGSFQRTVVVVVASVVTAGTVCFSLWVLVNLIILRVVHESEPEMVPARPAVRLSPILNLPPGLEPSVADGYGLTLSPVREPVRITGPTIAPHKDKSVRPQDVEVSAPVVATAVSETVIPADAVREAVASVQYEVVEEIGHADFPEVAADSTVDAPNTIVEGPAPIPDSPESVDVEVTASPAYEVVEEIGQADVNQVPAIAVVDASTSGLAEVASPVLDEVVEEIGHAAPTHVPATAVVGGPTDGVAEVAPPVPEEVAGELTSPMSDVVTGPVSSDGDVLQHGDAPEDVGVAVVPSGQYEVVEEIGHAAPTQVPATAVVGGPTDGVAEVAPLGPDQVEAELTSTTPAVVSESVSPVEEVLRQADGPADVAVTVAPPIRYEVVEEIGHADPALMSASFLVDGPDTDVVASVPGADSLDDGGVGTLVSPVFEVVEEIGHADPNQFLIGSGVNGPDAGVMEPVPVAEASEESSVDAGVFAADVVVEEVGHADVSGVVEATGHVDAAAVIEEIGHAVVEEVGHGEVGGVADAGMLTEGDAGPANSPVDVQEMGTPESDQSEGAPVTDETTTSTVDGVAVEEIPGDDRSSAGEVTVPDVTRIGDDHQGPDQEFDSSRQGPIDGPDQDIPDSEPEPTNHRGRHPFVSLHRKGRRWR
ncbi:MAG: hypothetical protein FWF25_01905 [Propionibacteriaceae bacterium]|nr:hypothetical protein [Propionibacteriaceae bacterium]